ncbi:MAG: nuclear transport factor 2 family protein [Saprospiraceae bacterium]|nr:nuclear transport factor 2 family protein [Saprospiraceae bacterium]MCB9320989.1 nuclear transport factor 2 family protein [Lewinellaceae bacterium]
MNKLILYLLLLMTACTVPTPDLEQRKQEVRDAEKAFNDLAAKEGIRTAFVQFADSSAVMLRGNQLIRGKEAIDAYYSNQTLRDVHLSWSPDFVDVAASGDLGYTYGPYSFSAVDTAGQSIESRGYFHTVWRRQSDGSWKFVWD